MAKANPKPTANKSPKEVKKESGMKPAVLHGIFLSAILLLISIIRFRLLSFPLERDEGEYAYFGQLILDGIAPYKAAYNLKFPGTYYIYALIMSIFGQSTQGIHLGLLLFNLGSMVFIYQIVKKLFDPFPALIASLTAGLLFVSPAVYGQAAHATHFVTFFMLAGTWILLLAFEKNSAVYFLLSGVMMGLAFLMKQSGIFFPLFGGLMILLEYFILRSRSLIKSGMHLIVYITGVILPVGIIFLMMYYSGVFSRFWFWTVVYTSEYGSRIPLSEAWNSFARAFPGFTGSFTLLWISAVAGMVLLFLGRENRWKKAFISLFVLFSFLPAVPGFYFRLHYFVPFLPAIGILCGLFFYQLKNLAEKHFRQSGFALAGLFVLLAIVGLGASKEFFFSQPTRELCREIYKGNLFAESVNVSRFIEKNTSASDTLFVCASEPQIYFYTHRKAATSYIYMYDLVFNHKYVAEMQQEMMRQVEKSHPKYILFASCPSSWLAQAKVGDTITSWFNKYVQDKKYILTGVADYLYPNPTIYSWNEDARSYVRKSDIFMVLLRRLD